MSLTKAYKTFAQAIADGYHRNEACRMAYPNLSERAIPDRAQELAQREDIIGLIATLRNASGSVDLDSVDGIVKEKTRLYHIAKASGKTNDAARLLDQIVELQGLNSIGESGVDDPNDIVARLRRGIDHARRNYNNTLADPPAPDSA